MNVSPLIIYAEDQAIGRAVRGLSSDSIHDLKAFGAHSDGQNDSTGHVSHH